MSANDLNSKRKLEHSTERDGASKAARKESEFEKVVLKHIVKVYDDDHQPRKQAQTLVDTLSSVTQALIKDLSRDVKSCLEKENVKPETIKNLDDMFTDYTAMFSEFATESLCFNRLKDLDLYKEPITHMLGENRGTKNNLVHFDKYSVQVAPLNFVLSKFLELPGVLHTIMDFVSDLKDHSTVLSNVTQGDFWKQKVAGYNDKIVLPLKLYFDDCELGNPLGSHATIHKVGAVYIQFGCLPPLHSSCLDNIFLAELFHSSDVKKFSAAVVFSQLIEQLTDLEEQGLRVNVNGEEHTIYVLVSNLIGDNLGLNQILGFSQGFRATRYCRFCTVTSKVAETLTEEDCSLMRSEANYKEELKLDQKETGIKEECPFNALPSFHATRNPTVDIAHDILEGVCSFEIAEILHKFVIKDKIITLESLNNKINNSSYPPDTCKPPLIDINNIKSKHIKMSASEMQNFFVHFGVMLGDMIPEENVYWKFYTKLHAILCIVSARYFDIEKCDYLRILIREHHELYVKLFKKLKPKHHFLLHYPNICRQIGPLVDVSTLRFESKHREIKAVANVVASRVNICQTIAKKQQLKLSYRFLKKEGMILEMSHGKLSSVDEDLLRITPFSFDCKTTSWVKVQSNKYRPGNYLVVDVTDENPEFGKIIKIVIKGSSIIYVCKLFRTIVKDDHLCAYEIQPTQKTVVFNHADIIYCKPLNSTTVDKKLYIVSCVIF